LIIFSIPSFSLVKKPRPCLITVEEEKKQDDKEASKEPVRAKKRL